jgi:hypothetical protein
MSALPGGSASKYGQRYEGRWTVNALLRLLDEDAASIRLEEPGADFAEFLLRLSDGTNEYHQVKRASSKSDRWTIKTLLGKDLDVLGRFKDKLESDSSAFCVFASQQDALDLRVISSSARDAVTAQEFIDEFTLSKDRRSALQDLLEGWGVGEDETYDLLRRIRVEVASDETLLDFLRVRAEKLVDGDPLVVMDVLAQLPLERVHDELHADDLWRYLEERGLARRDWANDPHVLTAVGDATDQFLERLRSTAIGGELLQRDEAASMAADLRADIRLALASGEAGAGKSHVVLQAVDLLRAEMLVLAFRADAVNPGRDAKRIGADIGLTGSPAAVLAAIADGRHALLVIDQLDATSTASGRKSEFFEGIDSIVRQARAFPEIRVLVACRQFDLENDRRLRRFSERDSEGRTYAVGRLARPVVLTTLEKLGLDPSHLGETQLQLLELPLHLALLAEVAARPDAPSFATPNDLFALYWDAKQEKVEQRAGTSGEWMRIIETLCDHMSERQILSAPREMIIDEWRETTLAMASESVIVAQGTRFAFFHESFFDYAFVRRYIGRGGSLVDLLEEGDQHLFRRPQVRQFLSYERASGDPNYLLDIEAILGRDP